MHIVILYPHQLNAQVSNDIEPLEPNEFGEELDGYLISQRTIEVVFLAKSMLNSCQLY